MGNIKKTVVPTSPHELYRKIQAEREIGYKYLLIYRNEQEMTNVLDGNIYAISDINGKHLCDILQEDYIRLTDDLTIISTSETEKDIPYFSDWVVAEPEGREKVLGYRLVVIFLETEAELPPEEMGWPKLNLPTDFYEKEFKCRNSTISRGKLEGLPCPFYTAELTDEQMQTIIDETDAETRSRWRISPVQFIDFDNEEYDDAWWEELEKAVLRQNVPYYEDIVPAYHGTPNPNVQFLTNENRVIYFTDDRSIAEHFARAEDRGGLLAGEIPMLIHARIILRHPYVINTEEEWMEIADDTVIHKKGLIAQGYDSILHRNEAGVAYYAIFDANNCKIIQRENITI